MNYRCTSCDIPFESENKPRCPVCLRMSTVVEEEARGGGGAPRLGPWLKKHAWWLLAVPLTIGAGVGGWWVYRSVNAPELEQVEAPLPESLSEIERATLDTIRSSGAAELGAEAIAGFDHRAAMHHISRLFESRIAFDTLRVIPASQRPRRPPLQPDLLARDALPALLAGEEAYLYPSEIGLLIWTAAVEAGLTVDVVLLEGLEPTLDRLPTPGVRVVTSSAIQAIDPRSGERVDASHLDGAGVELLWACRALIGARYALSRGDLDGAERWVEQARRLAPDLWMTRAAQAELALARGDREAATAHASGLKEAADHPYAWLVAARVEAGALEGAERDARMIERLEHIVEAFPHEAELTVELASLLRRQAHYQASRDAYERALLRDSEVAGAHTGLARLYARADPERAMGHIRRELIEHPEHAEAYLTLAYLHALSGASKDAERAASQGRATAVDAERFDDALERLLGEVERE